MRFTLACLVVALAPLSLSAKGPAYTDPSKTDADFPIQGEYAGSIPGKDGDKQIGIQVIALGKGKFEAVAYMGGLPGAGWNGNRDQIHRHQGERNDEGAVVFADAEKKGKGVVADGVLSLYHDDNKIAELKKTERKSPSLGQKPPAGAVVLFDGSSVDGWKNGKLTEDKLLMQGTTSKATFGSHKLHIEFRLPYQPEDRGQGRGNSGIYLQGRYECQMLDSFGLEGKQNECGGLYSVKAPDLNMCLPPLSWQTYDIEYTAAKYDGEKLVENPRVTIRHNGVLIHDDVELPGNRNTTAAPTKAGPDKGPVYLQNHTNPVRYRNIWVAEK